MNQWFQKFNQMVRASKRDPEIWPTMVFTLAIVMYGTHVAYRKLKEK
jgi:hypothetical protein